MARRQNPFIGFVILVVIIIAVLMLVFKTAVGRWLGLVA